MVLVASNTGENDSAPYFRSRFSSKLHVFLKTVRAKQKIDFFFSDRKRQDSSSALGFSQFPPYRLRHRGEGGKEGGRIMGGKELGSIREEGTGDTKSSRIKKESDSRAWS